MQKVRIEKVTINVGAGVNQDVLKKAMKLVGNLAGKPPVKTISNKRIPTWGVRPGLPIGCKLTLRGKAAEDVLKRTLAAKENTLQDGCFDTRGNVSFGLQEYIDVPGLAYDPEIGVMGMQITATLEKPGYGIKRRKIAPKKVGAKHLLKKEECIKFFEDNFKIKVVK